MTCVKAGRAVAVREWELEPPEGIAMSDASIREPAETSGMGSGAGRGGAGGAGGGSGGAVEQAIRRSRTQKAP